MEAAITLRKTLNDKITQEYFEPESKQDMEFCVKKTLKSTLDASLNSLLNSSPQILVSEI